METKRFRIEGMSCQNCQDRITAALLKSRGVGSAKVDYRSGRAEVAFDADKTSFARIAAVVEGLDYGILVESEGAFDWKRAACILLLVVCLYALLERTGAVNFLLPGALADSQMGFFMLVLIGLTTSLHCVAMCGGIHLSQSLPSDAQKASFLPGLWVNLGRVLSYTAVGFLLGGVGALFRGGAGSPLPAAAQGALKIIAGLFMAGMGLNMLGVFPWLRRLILRLPGGFSGRRGHPFVAGLLNGLMPCGPLQSMQIVALASGSPLLGALSMLAFGLGTLPLMLGLGAAVALLGRRFKRAVSAIGAGLVAVLGLLMLAQGTSLTGLLAPEKLLVLVIALFGLGLVMAIPFKGRFTRGIWALALLCALALPLLRGGLSIGPIGNAGGGNADRAEILSGRQIVRSSLKPGGYPDIEVEAGLPLTWVIDAPQGSVNGCNNRLLIPEYGIEYAFQTGENTIEFTPEAAGVVPYSCWMGMIRGSIIIKEEKG
ncbi:MAG: sulfite exporter TauE/SafE family protein [Christensenellaceae bacterium]|jgi:sulfite exporter TauE/SafE/copper chaperone CopZ|nr:sulfite exporter TauE/SafE family protein [Christensenellaceae bacterium]